MVVVEPILALITLNHIIFDVLKRVRLFAITITIEIVLVIIVLFIFIIQLFVEQLACQRHSSVATVASEIQF
jgi:hypothetical protein